VGDMQIGAERQSFTVGVGWVGNCVSDLAVTKAISGCITL